ncbi:MAG: NAD(P)/FAD-dependent oxidoreductase [Mycoplasmataceae bacterium]|jgi:thioredoxin reductase (NADPH)|nr:NAD(P)/FAD-dependent oxidoreductase [Mycoplasmataceae bacterium]
MNDAAIFDVVIVGGGPIGIYGCYLAAIKGLKPCLIEASDTLGGQPSVLYPQKYIYDFPYFAKIKAHDLIAGLYQQLLTQKDKIVIKTNCEVVNYAFNDAIYTLTLNNQTTIATKNIIIASGTGKFNPNKLSISFPEKINQHLHYFVADINFFKNKKVVICGGGDSAVDWANELKEKQITDHVTIIHRRDQFRANGENVERLTKNRVNLVLNQQIAAINEQAIVTDQNQTIPYDEIIVQYGQAIDLNNLGFIPTIKFDQLKKIQVDQSMHTNLPNIYACGNACNYPNKPGTIIPGMGEIAVAINSIINSLKKY